MSETERRYTEQELRLILKRASRLQEGLNTDGTSGVFSLTEIQSVAEAAGIDPRYIAEAARDLSKEEPPRNPFLRAAPSHYEFSETWPTELEPGAIADVVEAARLESEDAGVIGEVLDTVEWRARDMYRTRMTITRRSGRTRIRIFLEGDRAQSLLFLLGGAAGAMASLIAAASVNDWGSAWAWLAGGAVGTYGVLHGVWWKVSNGMERRGREMFQAITRAVSDEMKQQSASDVRTDEQGVSQIYPSS
jgi:hypothetical protein